MHVLIIEDEPLIAMSVEDALRECDCVSFDFANSVEQALRRKFDAQTLSPQMWIFRQGAG